MPCAALATPPPRPAWLTSHAATAEEVLKPTARPRGASRSEDLAARPAGRPPPPSLRPGSAPRPRPERPRRLPAARPHAASPRAGAQVQQRLPPDLLELTHSTLIKEPTHRIDALGHGKKKLERDA